MSGTPGAPAGDAKIGHAEHIEQCRAEQEANEDFTENGRLMDTVGQRTGNLGRRDDQRQQQDDLKGMGQRTLRWAPR